MFEQVAEIYQVSIDNWTLLNEEDKKEQLLQRVIVFLSELKRGPDATPESVIPLYNALHHLISDGMGVPNNHEIEKSAIVDKIKNFIKANVGNDFSRGDIAAHVHFNSDHVSRLFKKKTGRSLQEFVIQVKIEHAKQLLIRSDSKISEVGMSVGYKNIPYFTNLFKKQVGIPPYAFRKKYQKID